MFHLFHHRSLPIFELGNRSVDLQSRALFFSCLVKLNNSTAGYAFQF
jgi:hypothetical protein